MGNMSYCRFRNTLEDLRDCYESMDETGDLSREEERARISLLKLCANIIADYGWEIEE